MYLLYIFRQASMTSWPATGYVRGPVAQWTRRLHCKKSWRKTPPAWPDDAVLKYQGDGTLFWHADRVNPTSSDNEDEIFRSAMELSYGFFSHAKEFSDNFPSTFRRMNPNPKQYHRGSNLQISGFQSNTLPLRHSYLLKSSSLSIIVFLCQYSVNLFRWLFSFVSTLSWNF